jgi:hypothetical protein
VDRVSGPLLCLTWLFAHGCNLDGTPSPDQVFLLDPGPPAITDVSWSCDADLERWRLDIGCDSWSNGGLLYLSEDFSYIEEHPIKSRKAADDGSADELRVDLSIAADWREVSAGKSTAFGCSQVPNGLFVVYDRQDEVADCRRFGPYPAGWTGAPNVPACDSDWTDTGLISGT